MGYTQAKFFGVDPEDGPYFSVDSATNINPARLPASLRDPYSPIPGRLPLETLVGELQADGTVRLGEEIVFDLKTWRSEDETWIVGRYGAAKRLGLSQATIRRTLEHEDGAWALRLGYVHAWNVGSLDAWYRDTHAPAVAAAHRTAASLPRRGRGGPPEIVVNTVGEFSAKAG